MSATYLRETIDLVKQIETRFLELGARLYRIQEDQMWQGEYDSYGEYLDATGLKRPFASVLTTIHRVYVVERGVRPVELAEAGYAKLYDAIPLLENNDTAAVVAKAQLLSRGEIKEEVREEKYGDCQHRETITICAHCHKRV